jgi:putative transposase
VQRESGRAPHARGRPAPEADAAVSHHDGFDAYRPHRRECVGPAICGDDDPPAQSGLVSDITYIATREGWLYLAIVLDLRSRRVVGWAMRHTLEWELARDALAMALGQRQPAPGLVHHSDRGVQYACDGYRTVLSERAITASMSRRGNCWDNAVAESFFATLKTELVMDADWATREEARCALFRYIEMWYNRRRRHSSLGYLSPLEFERLHDYAA